MRYTVTIRALCIGVLVLVASQAVAITPEIEQQNELQASFELMQEQRDQFLQNQTQENKAVSDASSTTFANDLCQYALTYIDVIERDFGLPTDDLEVMDTWLQPERERIQELCDTLEQSTSYAASSRIVWNEFTDEWLRLQQIIEVRRMWLLHTLLFSVIQSTQDVQAELRSLQQQFDQDAAANGYVVDWTEWELLFTTTDEKITSTTTLLTNDDVSTTPSWAVVRAEGFAWGADQEQVDSFFKEIETVTVLLANTTDGLYSIASEIVTAASQEPGVDQILEN